MSAASYSWTWCWHAGTKPLKPRTHAWTNTINYVFYRHCHEDNHPNWHKFRNVALVSSTFRTEPGAYWTSAITARWLLDGHLPAFPSQFEGSFEALLGYRHSFTNLAFSTSWWNINECEPNGRILIPSLVNQVWKWLVLPFLARKMNILKILTFWTIKMGF